MPLLVKRYDFEFNFVSVLILVQNFLHGGIQLWNRYDQIPFSYLHLCGGIYTPDHLITAASYALLNFFKASASGETFYRFFVVFFHSFALLLRTIIGYLLLKRFCDSRFVIFVLLVMLNTVLSSHMHQGFGLIFVYMMFILVMHVTLSFFEEPSFRNLLLIVGAYGLVASASPLFSASYFYLGFHCFAFSALVWAFFKNREKIKSAWGTALVFDRTKKIDAAVTAAFLIILLLPAVLMLLHAGHDYQFASESSRFNDMLSISEYFKRPAFWGPQNELLPNFVNFHVNNWGGSWIFVGIFTITTALFGFLVSKDSRKYVFALTTLLFILMNSSRDSHGLFYLNTVFHWWHAITSPFKFIPRSFHMTGAMLIPYALLPLMAMGLQRMVDLIRQQEPLSSQTKIAIAAWGTVLVGLTLSYKYMIKIPPDVWMYLVINLVLVIFGLVALLLLRRSRFRAVLFMVVVCALALIDMSKLTTYFKLFYVELHGLVSKQIHYAGPTKSPLPVLEFKNPAVLPNQDRFNGHSVDNEEDQCFFNGQAVSRGLIFGAVNLGRYSMPANQYQPRHMAYTPVERNKSLIDYIQASRKIVSFAPYAVAEGTGIFDSLVKSALADKIIVLGGKAGLATENMHPWGDPLPHSLPEEKKSIMTLELDMSKSIVRDMGEFNVFSLPAPEECRSWEGTTVFAPMPDGPVVQLQGLQNAELEIQQGLLTKPYAYEVNTFQVGRLSFSLPKAFDLKSVRPVLKLTRVLDNGVVGILKNTPDRLDFSFASEKSGFVLFHMPYDPKWKILVDGVETEIYPANISFMAIPISAGKHDVSLRYWPKSVLRPLLWLSSIASVLGLVFLLGLCFKDQEIRKRVKAESVRLP